MLILDKKVEKEKIAIITTWYPPYNAEYIRDQAEALCQVYDVHVFYFRFSIAHKSFVKNENGLTVHRISFPYLPKKTQWTMEYWTSRAAKYVARADKKYNYKLLHGHAYLAGFVAYEASKLLEKPYYVTLHNTNLLQHTYNRIVEHNLKKSLPKARGVICVGDSLYQSVQDKYKLSNISLIPNMVDVHKFGLLEKKQSTPFNFLVVGSMDKRKRLNEILLALKGIKTSVHLHVVGNIIDPLDVNDIDTKVTYHGPLPNDQLPRVMAKCHSLISFSYEETFGITVIEAMSCGLPIIYCASGGPEHVVPEWAGIEVIGTVEGLQGGMEEIIDQYPQFDSRKIRQHIVESYSQERVVQLLSKCYNQLS